MRVSLVLLPAALSLASQAAAASVVYLFEISAYNNARECVQECATEYSNVGVNTFGCAAGGEVATCLCSNNVDQSSYMSSWYSSCALNKCSDEDDASTAVEIFADYCKANLDANTPLSVPATTTTAGFTNSASPGASPAGSTATPTGNGDGNGSGGGNGSGNGNGNAGNNDGNTNTTNNYGAGATIRPAGIWVPAYILAILLSLAVLL